MKMNILPLVVILLPGFLTAIEYSEEEKLMAEIEITDLELQDDCQNLASGIRSSLINRNFREKITVEQAHGRLMKTQSENLKSYEDVPFGVMRNWTLLTKCGDALLEEDDWNKLVSYYNANEELLNVAKVTCANGIPGCTFDKSGYRKILATSKDEDMLRNTWSRWQEVLLSSKNQYPSILELVEKAASSNGKEDAKSYWEMLLEQEDAYARAEAMWEEIQPLYLKLHNFTKSRLFRHYNISEDNSTSIPVYLLGSNFGDDWSHIADLILPHPQLHYDAETYLKTKSLPEVYHMAEKLTEQLSLGPLGNEFWSNSLFNMSACDNTILSFCSDGYSEVLTCDKSSWVRYLDSFETAMDVALRNNDYTSLARLKLRNSAFDDAIVSLGSTLAVESLAFNGVLEEGVFASELEDDPKKMTKLLLLALRVLPKLPFYLVADRWRLQELQADSKNLSQTWWNMRNAMQKVEGVSNDEFDFLGEHYMISNRPYLSKFFGIILQFQILSYYRSQMVNPNDNIALEIGKDDNLGQIIRERAANDWGYLTNLYYGIYDVSSSALLEYFTPLETYLESAPLEQEQIVMTTRRPSTTTQTTIQTTTPTVTTTTITIKAAKKPVGLSRIVAENSSLLASDQPPPSPEVRDNIVKAHTSLPPEQIAMYVGIGVLIAVAIVVSLGIIKTKCKRRPKLPHNRRFET